MQIIETPIPDLYILIPTVYKDNRGYFYESYNKQTLNKLGIDTEFVQDNQSKSVYGVIRGLHYQLEPFAQTKLVRAIQGKILDVAVDIRIGSPTFGKYFAVELSEENKKQLYIPRGFAHGFSVISEIAIVLYKTDNYYNKNAERGILFNDKKLNIDWKIPAEKQIISEKDLKNTTFENLETNFYYK